MHRFESMNFKVIISFCVLIVGITYLQSCKEPAEPVDISLLEGKWLIVNAKRNAKPTTTLNEAYFVFNNNSTMHTNFMGEEIEGSYHISGNVINQETPTHEGDLSYEILSLSRDSLILSSEIMNHKFEFYLLNGRLDPFDKKEEEMDALELPGEQADIES